ncbi:MAG: right-handed parallel beta-helix repeat-containing protein, partial [Prevotellaceae bacterium]|nr:right-handed parallel beta-helix repeat-containing protein [Prevotellaceae bacterium]
MKRILTIILFAALTAATVKAQTIRYVKQGGTGDGSSWADASGSLQEMINASTAGDEVWVDAGIYKPTHTAAGSNSNPNDRNNTFLMKAGVKIYGGFTAAETSLAQRNLAENKSILSGDIDNDGVLNTGNVYVVVTVAGDMGGALLDGFTITESYGGRGINISSGAMTFSNLIVKNNTGNGGGITLAGTGSTLTNVVIANNAAVNGGGILVSGGTHYMTNATIVNNTCTDNGGAIFAYNNGTLNLRNSIIWGNNGSVVFQYQGGNVVHSFNLLQSSAVSGTTIVSVADPLFTNATAGDYSLTPFSPAMNIGNNALYNSDQVPDISGTTTDIVGNQRIQDCKIDLGAYETTAAIAPTAGRIYVRAGATGKGSSWDDAYPNLAYPLRIAATCGITEILVAEGTYYPMYSPSTNVVRDKTFLMVAGVKIYGGFNNTLTGTTAATPPLFGSTDRKGVSILSGDIDKDGVLNVGNAYNVVTVAGDMGNAILDGFTVTESYGGRGINVSSGAMTFSNLIVRHNKGNGGGIVLSGTGSVLTNIVIADNNSVNGGGINMSSGTHYITNATIANNTCTDNGGAIFAGGGALHLRNSIIWGNSGSVIYGGSRVTHSNNLLQGGSLGSGVVVILNPQFTDPAVGDYSLKSESPAIDVGNKLLYDAGQTPDISDIALDLAGESRVRGCNIDLGAYEAPVSITPTTEGRVYVREGATGKGSSWDDAYPNIAFPLRLAAICGITEILVAEGTYYPMFPPSTTNDRDKTFLMVAGVKIYGGFNAALTGTTAAIPPLFGSTDRNGVSILSGDIDKDGVLNGGNAYNVFTVAGDMGNALLDGFTVTESYGGRGINVSSGAMTFSNLIVRHNKGNGGGITLSGTGSVLTNIVITDNNSVNGGGIFVSGGTHYMTNATIANNTCTDNGGAIFAGSGTLYLRNSIIWGNNGSVIYGGSRVTHSNNLLQGGSLGSGIVAILNPQFTDPAAGDYSLKPESPAIDIGVDTLYDVGQTPDISDITIDVTGNPRIQGGYIDLGAYEMPVFFAPTAEGIVYVKEGATGQGTSWDDAYPNLAYPLRMATIHNIKEIYVAEGRYIPMFPPSTVTDRDKTFLMVAGVKIYGGFNNTLTGTTDVPPFFGSTDRKGVSILSGDIGVEGTVSDNAYVVVTVASDMGGALLDGFTVTESYGGRGINISSGAMTFSNLIVKNNTGNGGGITLSGTGSTLTNVVIANNAAVNGGGILVSGGTHYMTNVTIVNNTCTDNGGAIFAYNNGTLNLRNSIIWGNNGSVIFQYQGGSVKHFNNLLQGGSLGNGVVAILNPQFTDAAADDYTLQVGSPAIDMGDVTFYNSGQTPDISGITTDLAGSPRVQGEHIDLGPYEASTLKPSAEGMVYVIEGGKGEADGSSWDDAYPNLAYPLRMAKICGVKAIFVAEGTYYPMFPPATTAERDKTFLMVEDVKVYGGFNGTLTGAPTTAPFFGFTGRNGVSILSGDIGTAGTATDNVYSVVSVAGDMGDAILDGFTVTGSYGGRGINVGSGAMTFSNLIVRHNTGNGGGITLSGTGSVLTNIVITDNNSVNGGGILVSGGTHYMTNATIANNRCTDNGGAIFAQNNGTLNLRNSIIWGNNGSVIFQYRGGYVNHFNNLLQGGTLGNGIVSNTDPMFNSDYSLQTGSPAIDMGNKTLFNAGQTPDISSITADIAGNPRIQGGNIDLGPYESADCMAYTTDVSGRLYVNKWVSGGNGSGSSWYDAMPKLATALMAARNNSEIKEIWVARGIYNPLF